MDGCLKEPLNIMNNIACFVHTFLTQVFKQTSLHSSLWI